MPPTLRPVCNTSKFPSERLSRIFRYWQSKSDGRFAPRREDVLPTEIRGDLPWVWLADVIDNGADFGFRLAGEELRNFLGTNYATKRVSQCLESSFFVNARKVFSHCVQIRQPLLVGPLLTSYEPRNYKMNTILVMPLSEDGTNVTMLFGAFESRKVEEDEIKRPLDAGATSDTTAKSVFSQ